MEYNENQIKEFIENYQTEQDNEAKRELEKKAKTETQKLKEQAKFILFDLLSNSENVERIENEDKDEYITKTIVELNNQKQFNKNTEIKNDQIQYLRNYLNYNFVIILQKARTEKERLKHKPTQEDFIKSREDFDTLCKAIKPRQNWLDIAISSTIKSKILHNLFKM